MSDPDAPSGQPRTSEAVAHGLVYWLSLILILIGDLLVIAAIFLPWIEVYKNDPSLPIPKRGYSPWMALQQHGFDFFGVQILIYLLLVLGLVIASLNFTRTSGTQLRVRYISIALALIGVILASLALWGIPISLSLNYPYYDNNVLDGGFVAIAGFLSVAVGAVILAIVEARRR